LFKTGSWRRRDKSSLGSHVEAARVEHHVVKGSGALNDSDFPDADVMVISWFGRAEAVRTVSERMGAKVYFLQHDDRSIVGTTFAKLHPRILQTWRFGWTMVAVSSWVADRVAREVPGARVKVAGNGVDRVVFAPRERCKRSGPLVLGIYFTTSPFKGCDVALEAYQIARGKFGERIQLVAMGLGERPGADLFPPEAEYVQSPSREKIGDFYAGCDLWLFTSREEGYGLPILEAMSCGTPVLATRTGAAEELCSGGGGVLVNVDDVDALVEQICQFERMSAMDWQRMSEAAMRTAAANDLISATDRFERELLDIVGSQQRMK